MKLHETGSYSNEDVLTAAQDNYELSQYDEEHEKTIHAGKYYAMALWKANREGEASELLTMLLATSLKYLVLTIVPPRRLHRVSNAKTEV
jgi:hypothetical protein